MALGYKFFIVLNGKEGNPYDNLADGTLIFSPNSKRLAYVAQLDNEWFTVVNGIEEKHYPSVLGPPIFSHNSKRLAYGAEVENKQFAIVDGKEQKHYDGLIGDLAFSSDSKRFAYAAFYEAPEKEKKHCFVVVDSSEGKQYDAILSMEGKRSILDFSSDKLHYLASKGDEIYLVEEMLK